jgi:hypothetical protein
VLLAREGCVARYSPDGTNLSTYSIAGVTGLAADEESTFWAVTPSSLERHPVTGTGTFESLTYQGSTFAPETVAVNYPFPPKPIIFVHGFRQSAGGANFSAILDPIEADLGLGAVTNFVWYQDSLLQGPNCPGSYPSPLGSIHINGLGPADPACDSQAAIGPNAVRLHDRVAERYSSSRGQKVILLGYSQGGATIRGMLDYSVDIDSGVAETMVDTCSSSRRFTKAPMAH